MKIKTNELISPALDWAIAKCLGYLGHIRLNKFKEWEDLGRTQVRDDDYTLWNPSADPAQAWPIIEREKIGWFWDAGNEQWCAANPKGTFCEDGPTSLIAAMRCYVVSKLGDTVDVPEELLK